MRRWMRLAASEPTSSGIVQPCAPRVQRSGSRRACPVAWTALLGRQPSCGLRRRKAGRSMEAEARMILAEAVGEQSRSRSTLPGCGHSCCGSTGGKLPTGVVDDLIARTTARSQARAGGVIVLDSSALLAMLFFEPGCERVAELVPQSCMSTVNLAEVLGRLARDGRALDEALDQIEQMGIVSIDFDRELAIGAAALLLPTVPWGLSLGDRACLALAQLRDLPAVTADRAWANLDLALRSRSYAEARAAGCCSARAVSRAGRPERGSSRRLPVALPNAPTHSSRCSARGCQVKARSAPLNRDEHAGIRRGASTADQQVTAGAASLVRAL